MFNLSFLLFQDAGEETTEATTSLVEIITSGGPIAIAIFTILLILSIAAVYIFFERFLTIGQAGKIDDNFINNIRAAVAAGNINGAKSLCANNDTPVARMVEKGLSRIGRPLKDIEASVENVGNLEVFKLEKNLSSLASISGAAPMIGFLGTVTGMILAFYKMSSENNVTPDVLAGGIYQALTTTAFGLIIGIFSFVGYNILVAKTEKVIFEMERTTVEFMDLLQEPSN